MRNFGIKQVGKDQIATVKNNTKPTFRQSEVQIELEITTVALHIGYYVTNRAVTMFTRKACDGTLYVNSVVTSSVA